MSLAYVILDLVFSEYAMKGIFQYSVKRTLVVLKIDNETNVRVDVAADTNEIPFLKRGDYRENPFGNDRAQQQLDSRPTGSTSLPVTNLSELAK